MFDIWLGSTVLLLLAMVFILWPVLKNRNAVLSDGNVPLTQQALNIVVYKDRLQELQKEKANGLITESKYDELLSELESSLLADADDKVELEGASRKVNVQKLPIAAALVMIMILPLASWGLYWKWGAYVSLEDSRTNDSVVAAEGMPSTDIEQLLETLKQRLAENPDNLDGWFLLGRSYMNMERFEEAAVAFNKVAALLEKQGEDPSSVYGMVAQALYFSDQGMSEAASSVMNKALQLNPNEINSLGLLGMQAFDDQRYVDAIRAWQKILDVAPAHPSRLAIEEGISKARVHLNESGVAVPDEIQTPQSAPPAPISGPRLTINVDILPELRKSAAPEDTLFVYARAMNGPKMPLAIVRKQVQDLPFTVVLDDSMAMGPMAKLSSFPEVEVLARVSKLGAPAPNPGDLEGRLGPIETESAEGELFVLIETVVR